MDKVPHNMQPMDQQLQHALQQHKQILQQVGGVERVRQQQDHLSIERRHQETSQAIGQFAHAQYHVQAILTNPSKDLLMPRFSIRVRDYTRANA